MVRFYTRRPALYTLVRRLDREPLDAPRAPDHLRPLHLETLLPLRLAPKYRTLQTEQTLQDRLRVGQRHHLRNGRRYARAHLHLPDVRDPHLVDGEVAARRRLPLRQQGIIRAPDAQHAPVVPLRPPHDALLADQKIILRSDQVALPPAQGTQAHPPKRRRGLQLPGRRHRAPGKPVGDLLRRAARFRGVVRKGGGTQTPQREVHGHQPARGQTRKLHQALRGPARRLARDPRRTGLCQRRTPGADPRLAELLPPSRSMRSTTSESPNTAGTAPPTTWPSPERPPRRSGT